jgi:hypothetical protein
VVALALLTIVGRIGRSAYGDEQVPCDRRLPKNVLAFMSLRNVSDFKTQWSKTMFGQLEHDEALAEFRADVEKQLAEASQQLEDQIGLSLSELVSIPHGEIAAAALIGQGGKIAVVVFLDFGEREGDVQKLLSKAADEFENEGLKRSEEDIEDTPVIVYKKPDDDGEKLRETGAYFLKDTFLVLGSDHTVLKSVLARWDGKHDRVLADNDVYRCIVEKCRDENSDAPPQLTWFIDVTELTKAAIASAQAAMAQREAAGQMAMVAGVIPMLGIDRFRGIGGTFDMAQGDFDTVSRTLVYLDRPAKGIVNMFQFDATPQAPPKWVTADWSSYIGVNWNLAKAFAAAEGLVDMFQGPGWLATMIQSYADSENSGGIHLKKDLVDQITGTMHIVEDDGQSNAGSAEGFLVAVELRNGAAFRATLAKISRIPGLKIEEREFQGETLYEFTPPGAGVPNAPTGDDDDDDATASGPYGLAVVGQQLLISSDVRLVERVLRGGGGDREPLAETPEYKSISRRFPAQTAVISFSRQDSQIKQIYELLQTGTAALPTGPLASFDLSKLPELDVLKKYMPASGGFMQNEERGLKFTSFSLRRETE